MTTDENRVSQACFTCNTPLDVARLPRKGRWSPFVGADGGGIVVDGRTVVFAVEAFPVSTSRDHGPSGVLRRLVSMGARPGHEIHVEFDDTRTAAVGAMGHGVVDEGRRIVTAEPPPGAVLMCAAGGHGGDGFCEAALEAIADEAVLAAKDAGGAGLGRALGAMAVAGEVSMEIDLDQVPGYDAGRGVADNLGDRSGHRMLLAVVMGREDDVRELFGRHGVPCEVVGETSVGDALTIRVGGKTVAEVPIESLAQPLEGVTRQPFAAPSGGVAPVDAGAVADGLLSHLTPREREALSPGAVSHELLPFSSPDGRKRFLARVFVSCSIAEGLDARAAARQAVAEAVLALTRVGCEPAAVVCTLTIGAGREADQSALLEGIADGLSEACTALALPVVASDLLLDGEGAQATLCLGVMALTGEAPDEGNARA